MEQKLNQYFKTWSPQTECIVVGSSPSLTWYEFGNYIDKFDTVVRINKCFNEDYYPNTGKKLDIWATTDNTRWGLFNPVNSSTKEVWTRNHHVINDLNNNGTFDIFDERKFTGSVVNIEAGRDSLRFPYPGLGTGLIALNEAIRRYNQITIIGHTFYLEGGNEALNFGSTEEGEEHKNNRLTYYNGDLHRITQIKYVLNWINEGKIILLNPYEYDNLKNRIK